MYGRSDSRAQRGDWTGYGDTAVTGITVAAGNNTQALAVALTGGVNVVGTSSATASTGVRLPAACQAGDTLIVANQGANTTLVYPQVGGAIDALSANAGFSMATGTKAVFVATSATGWVAILSA